MHEIDGGRLDKLRRSLPPTLLIPMTRYCVCTTSICGSSKQGPQRNTSSRTQDKSPSPEIPRTPWITSQPPPSEAGVELRTYWPVSRRYMLYTWRYLRRPVKDGPWDVLNVEATIEHSARQGFFLRPVYERRESNHAHLILMLDQGGSMIPFHRFTRDIVETASEESAIRQVEVVYFHNVPPPTVFSDPYLTEPLLLEQILERCGPDSSVLLVSDACASRGYRSTTRIRTTTDFIVKLKQRTTLIAWLNPMPQHRWKGTSAQFIARLVPMFQMDRDGFSNAVDVLRGQPLQAYR